jgi:hypothetical protein
MFWAKQPKSIVISKNTTTRSWSKVTFCCTICVAFDLGNNRWMPYNLFNLSSIGSMD